MSSSLSRPLARRRTLPALLLVAAVALASSPSPRHTAAKATSAPARAATADSAAALQTRMPADLREAVERSRYRVRAQEDAALPGSYEASNPGQGFRATFTDAGLRLRPGAASAGAAPAAGWEWGLSLRGYGYGEQVREAGRAALAAEENRVEYRRGEVTEWYVNERRGIEQGFTLAARPAGGRGDGPLALCLRVEGDLRAESSADGRWIYFVAEGGGRVLSYGELAAFDARGVGLAARMRVVDGEVWLEVEDAGAEYPVTIEKKLIVLKAKLTASTAGTSDHFGQSVAIRGDIAVVGAPNDDTAAGADAGSAYIFVRKNGVWSEQKKLTASDASAHDFFGFSVAIGTTTIPIDTLSPDPTVVVGAPGDDTTAGGGAGSAYVFVRSNGVWSQKKKLTASDAGAFHWFGNSVAISGPTIVVGARYDYEQPGANAGSAYVFVRSYGAWGQQKKLTASDGVAGDRFGVSVAISGNTVVVGAYKEGGQDAGKAYVFVRSNGVWSQQKKLTASYAGPIDGFGLSVAISVNTAVVGAPYASTTPAHEGSAYVFVRSAGVWSQKKKLTASTAAYFDRFGSSVAISGDTVVAGAPAGVDTAGPGSAYVFVRSNGVWSQQAKLTASTAATSDQFGHSVAISGDTIAVGAPKDDAPVADAGSVYIYGPTSSIILPDFP